MDLETSIFTGESNITYKELYELLNNTQDPIYFKGITKSKADAPDDETINADIMMLILVDDGFYNEDNDSYGIMFKDMPYNFAVNNGQPNNGNTIITITNTMEDPGEE
jgi:hypothetical protein